MSLNRVVIMGRLGKDPELKYTPSGSAVCNLTVATSESWNDKTTGQKQEKTEWHRIVVWGKKAELCNQYLIKGRQVLIEGKLETRSWEQDGQKRYTTEINASNVQFIGGGQNNEGMTAQDVANQMGGSATVEPVQTDASFAAEDIPF